MKSVIIKSGKNKGIMNILVYAPNTTFVVKYAVENDFACVVYERAHDKLQNALIMLLNNKVVSERIVKNSAKLVKQFDTILVSHRIQEILKQQVVC